MNKPLTAGLYVHVPFCKTKCPYCAFYSLPSISLISQWLEAVQKEILIYKDLFPTFDSLYIGGGTPTVLKIEQWSVLLESLFKFFSFSSNKEVSVEVNPDDVTTELMDCLHGLGVNRVSLGVQSFDDKELNFLKRHHTSNRAMEAFQCIRLAGFNNISMDLMYGLPEQTEGDWLKTIERALSFEPEHISCYELTIEEKTPFGKLRNKGMLKLPEEDQGRALFILTSTFLEDKGYLHYEISNFAKGEEQICHHNMKYWRHVPYLGLGPSAHSFQGGRRWWNLKSVKGYCRALKNGSSPVAGDEILSKEQHYLETLLLGLRTMDGIDRNILRNGPQTENTIRDLEESGLVRVEKGRVIPTREGFLVADSLPLLFSDY